MIGRFRENRTLHDMAVGPLLTDAVEKGF